METAQCQDCLTMRSHVEGVSLCPDSKILLESKEVKMILPSQEGDSSK